ncbi:hypothetical protein J3E68DRAFT_135221 [Trichoderma sp. SZMC 28012]
MVRTQWAKLPLHSHCITIKISRVMSLWLSLASLALSLTDSCKCANLGETRCSKAQSPNAWSELAHVHRASNELQPHWCRYQGTEPAPETLTGLQGSRIV